MSLDNTLKAMDAILTDAMNDPPRGEERDGMWQCWLEHKQTIEKQVRTLESRVKGLRLTLDNDPAGAGKRLVNLCSAFSTCDLCEQPCEDEASPNILCGACLSKLKAAAPPTRPAPPPAETP
jgi:hypothetical protein